MPTDPLVTVVLAVRDGEPFLAEAIDSVLAQEGVSLELLVVEDGSRDASAAIARSYGPPVTCLSTEPHGVAAARNVAIEAARGKYVAFIDADDVWPPGRLALQLEAIEKAPVPDIVFGHELRIPPDGSGPVPARNNTTALVRRSVFEEVGLLATEWRLGEFLDWLMRAADAGVTEVMLPDVVCHRRVHGGNLTIRERGAFGDYAKVLGRALARRREEAAGTE